MFNKSITTAAALAAVGALALSGCAAETPKPAPAPAPVVINDETNSAEDVSVDEVMANAISYEDAWVRWSENSEMIGGMTGAYVTLTNNSNTPYTLIGARIDGAAIVEVHEMIMGPDGMQMQQIDGGITLQPGETRVFEPGGDHLMIIGITKPFMAGDVVSMELIFAEENAPTVILENMIVKPVEAGGEDYDGGMDMDMDMDMDMGMDMGASE